MKRGLLPEQQAQRATSGPGPRGAPIIGEPHERGFDKDFRRPGEPPHVVHVNQHAPKGLARKLKEYVEVAGVTYEGRQATLQAFIDGSARRIELVRDPDNEFDPNAVRVVGAWTGLGGDEQTGLLGWLPKEVAAELAAKHQNVPTSATVETMFRARVGKSAGLRIDVWGPRRKRSSTPELPHDHSIRVPDTQSERIKLGMELEKAGLIENAIEMYNAAVRDRFDGSHPYDRLAVLFRKRKDYEREVEVLEMATEVYSDGLARGHEVHEKLDRFQQRLDKARRLLAENANSDLH